jgi:peptidoglycan/xylan/chitin deacetylase (PgdA/CDA1 family)
MTAGSVIIAIQGMTCPIFLTKLLTNSSEDLMKAVALLSVLAFEVTLSQAGTDGLENAAHSADTLRRSMNAVTPKNELSFGGIIRTDSTKKEIHLVFTGHEFGDGGEVIRSVLQRHGVKAAFFLTGDFYRNRKFSSLIQGLKSDGHYLGGHSDKHLLYCSWEKRDSLLVSKEEFIADLLANYAELEKFGVRKSDAPFFLPPYEWYNKSVSAWTEELGLTLVNFSPGTYSNADWTIPELGKQYLSSDTIYNRILSYENNHSAGLNGFILLTHIGVDPRRTDKFYLRLDGLLFELEKRGYTFTLLSAAIR